jgi:hypothetical protein
MKLRNAIQQCIRLGTTLLCFNFIYMHIYLPAALCPEVYSAPNINKYQKHKNNNVSGGWSAAGS